MDASGFLPILKCGFCGDTNYDFEEPENENNRVRCTNCGAVIKIEGRATSYETETIALRGRVAVPGRPEKKLKTGT